MSLIVVSESFRLAVVELSVEVVGSNIHFADF